MSIRQKPTYTILPKGTVVRTTFADHKELYVVARDEDSPKWILVEDLINGVAQGPPLLIHRSNLDPDFFLTEVLFHKGSHPNQVVENKEEKE